MWNLPLSFFENSTVLHEKEQNPAPGAYHPLKERS
jgi:hypothetical protein